MSYGFCFRCASNSSLFWHRMSYGCNEAGDNGEAFALCDSCFLKLMDFMRENITANEKITPNREVGENGPKE